jgi:Uma2 family endonuclease
MAIATTTTGNALSLADLEAMPDDGRRYELVGGAIVMTAAPAPIHQLVSARLHTILQAATPDGHVAFAAPIDLDLPDGQRVEPDLVVAPWSSVGEERLALPVLLVVEIVSPGSRTHDRVTKRAAYAEAGIPAYWLVDLPAGEIVALRLTETGTYETDGQGATLTLDWPLPVTLDLAELTRRPGKANGPQ